MGIFHRFVIFPLLLKYFSHFLHVFLARINQIECMMQVTHNCSCVFSDCLLGVSYFEKPSRDKITIKMS